VGKAFLQGSEALNFIGDSVSPIVASEQSSNWRC
jgi:hypothetical protein